MEDKPKMKNKSKEEPNSLKNESLKKGDKKLNGPNRPST
ncbi:spore protein [Virgibacillus necropolis]|nr:spore protein [Virgibacillus necropolis]